MTDIPPPELTPEMTAILSSGDAVTRMRGLVQDAVRPVAKAVVIGLGGTGVQTVARVKYAVQSSRVDQLARNAVSFVGVDSVGEGDQEPPLPTGVELGPDLVTLQGFNAGSYLAGQKPNDPFLQSWFDDDYQVPNSPLTDGFKRERMLGRLGFQRHLSAIQSQISSAMQAANAVDSSLVAGGDGGTGTNEIPVYLVASAVGGTGSSGFLEVVAAIHAAAAGLSLNAKIRTFLLLPGAFVGVLDGSQQKDVVMQAQQANAYGFFKELDHFLVNPMDFPKKMSVPLDMKERELVHQVYLFDSSLGGHGLLASVGDIYETLSEAIFQFLFTDMGRKLIGANGTNTDRILGDVDKHGKPRRYCSLGVARLVFPGDTYRHHLVMWWCDWIVRQGFLRPLTTTQEIGVGESEPVIDLVDSVHRLSQQATAGRYDDFVTTFLNQGRDAARSLEARAELAAAEELVANLDRDSAAVATEVRRTLEALRPRLVDELETLVEDAVFADGSSLIWAEEVLKHVQHHTNTQLGSARETENSQIASKNGSFARVEDRLEVLAVAEGRNVLESAVAAVVGLFDDETMSATDAGEAVGDAIKDWTRAIYESELANARRLFLEQAVDRLGELRQELKRARERLIRLAHAAKVQWEQDELLGKDAGAKATTVLLPGDTHPEVERSELSRALRQAVVDEHADKLEGAGLQEFVDRWIGESVLRGFFDLGSYDAVIARRAERSLLASLERDAIAYALHSPAPDGGTTSRLPVDLPAAAAVVGEEDRLATGLDGLEALSRNVCWSWEAGRFHPDPVAADDGRIITLMPEVTTGVSVHRTLDGLVQAQFPRAQKTTSPDPERLVALSCEWGVPLHCLRVVPSWKRSYDALERKRTKQRTEKKSIEPPNHVDKRFEDFKEVIPEYVEKQGAAMSFARGLVIAAALQAEDSASTAADCYVRDATNPPVSPVRSQRGDGFVLRTVTLEEGVLVPAPVDTETVVGKSWSETWRAIGLDTAIINVIDVCWNQIVRAVEPRQLEHLAEGILQDRVLRRKQRVSLADREVYGLLENAFREMADELANFD